ncbi:unnamed protein product [Amoebophrya sp. A120]|nr:unnamed protein product [Amoebophrya sp. A120]|eukprot:GSA120T00017467001.1
MVAPFFVSALCVFLVGATPNESTTHAPPSSSPSCPASGRATAWTTFLACDPPPLSPPPAADDFSAIFRRQTAWVMGAQREIIEHTLHDEDEDELVPVGATEIDVEGEGQGQDGADDIMRSREQLAEKMHSAKIRKADEDADAATATERVLYFASAAEQGQNFDQGTAAAAPNTHRTPSKVFVDYVPQGRCSSKLWNWWAVDELNLPFALAPQDALNQRSTTSCKNWVEVPDPRTPWQHLTTSC